MYRFIFDFGFDSFLLWVFEFSMKFSLGSNKYRIECCADISFFFLNLILGFFLSKPHAHKDIVWKAERERERERQYTH